MAGVVLVALVSSLAAVESRAQVALAPVLAFGGDVIFDAPVEYALRRTGSLRDEPASYAPIFEDVRPVLSAADLAIANLETPVAARTRSRSAEHDVPTFAAPAAFLHAVAAAGIDVVGVANNHAYDQGVAGLAGTLAAAEAAGVSVVGAGASARAAGAATRVRVLGHEIALLQFSEATNWRVVEEEASSPRIALLDEDAVERHVREARAGGAALVVAMFHWSDGRDPDDVPSARMRRFARIAADAGADLVVGHGTHLPAGTEVVPADDGRAVPVLWSIGNLAAVMEIEGGEVYGAAPSVRDALVARVRTEDDGGGRLRVRTVEVVPFWIDVSRAAGSPPFVRPLDLEREARAVREDACGALCDRLAAAYVERAARAARLSIADARAPSGVVEPPLRAPDRGVAGAETHDAPGVPAAGRRSTARVPAELARGVELRVGFPEGSATERAIDEAQLAAIVALLRTDRGLHAEIIAHPSAAEPNRALASRRARRIRGLIAVRGPSRSRLASRVGSTAEHANLELRVFRAVD